MKKIAIIGGGVAGVTTALTLSQLGLDITLFERESSLVSGPPFCHLHAGGNLYREISDEQCIKLLKQSIDFAKFYPFVVDYRPTVIALPISDKSRPDALISRLELLKKEYQKLINADPSNKILGESQHYYKLYTQEDMERLATQETSQMPSTQDEWMIPVAKSIDRESLQFPLVLVSEFGLNLFRLASGVRLAMEQEKSINLRLNTTLSNISKQQDHWLVDYEDSQEVSMESFDYIINAAGFRVGKIDDMLDAPCKRMVEFKSAYVTHSKAYEGVVFPEIIFHGERGTPRGMGQFTPYLDGYFQLHGMTQDITLYEDGLVESTPISCQPKLHSNFIEKIEKEWSIEERDKRTKRAIQHIAQFIPSFGDAVVGSKPLFGAQQIPGDDPTLRVAEVSFPLPHYARCEIVKVSSAIDMAATIIEELKKLGYIDDDKAMKIEWLYSMKEEDITQEAQKICSERDYPTSLAQRRVARLYRFLSGKIYSDIWYKSIVFSL
ncbi:MAG: FAD-dependent oxidoreductase [Campylobacterota bacterium]|nr:FAD-dependent oxidoreductase [Campylobacterota bacterium]